MAENFKFGEKTADGLVSEISTVLKGGSGNFAYFHDSHHSVVGMRHVVNGKVCDERKSLKTKYNL